MLKCAFFFLSLFISFSGSASGIAKFKGMDGGESYLLSLEYLDRNTSRINMDDNSDVKSYLLFKDRQAQVVTDYQGNTLVVDLANISSVAQNLGVMRVLGIDSETLLVRIISMEKTGKKERVAGIDGEVYKLTWSRNNVQQQDQLVVSSNRQAWEYTQAWIEAIEIISKSSPSIDINGDELLVGLRNDKLGILRLGDRFRLVSVQNRQLNPARFIAPDTSFTIPGLGGLLENM